MNVKWQINKDILEVAQTKGQDPEVIIKEYSELLPPSFDFQCEDEVPIIIKAWTALQIEKTLLYVTINLKP